MTVESFKKCPTPGCVIRVWGPDRTLNYCTAHGGNELGFMEIPEDDEFGLPLSDGAGTPPPGTAPLSEEDE